MDAFIAREEACHPSDNIGALLAAAELAKASGRDFLTAMAIAYHVQCRLAESPAPVITGPLHAFEGPMGLRQVLEKPSASIGAAKRMKACWPAALSDTTPSFTRNLSLKRWLTSGIRGAFASMRFGGSKSRFSKPATK